MVIIICDIKRWKEEEETSDKESECKESRREESGYKRR